MFGLAGVGAIGGEALLTVQSNSNTFSLSVYLWISTALAVERQSILGHGQDSSVQNKRSLDARVHTHFTHPRHGRLVAMSRPQEVESWRCICLFGNNRKTGSRTPQMLAMVTRQAQSPEVGCQRPRRSFRELLSRRAMSRGILAPKKDTAEESQVGSDRISDDTVIFFWRFSAALT